MDVRENDERQGKPAEDLVQIFLDPLDLDKVTYIGASLGKTPRDQLTKFLQKNNDVFAWTSADMRGIDPNLMTYKLNVDPTRKAFQHKKRTYAPDRLEAIKQEVEILLEAGFIEEAGYVDDMLVKRLAKDDHIDHLRKAFEVLRHHKMMLNPAKCVFNVGSGNFLDHMISKRGIEANPDKIKAILDMELPHSIKDVHKLTGIIASLGKFISKSGDKCLPFLKTLKKVKNFEWTAKSQEAFEQLKKHMSKDPLLAKPSPEDILYLYLTVSEQAVSAVLVKDEQKVQKPVYYVIKVLHEAKLNYSTTEKFAIALITTSKAMTILPGKQSLVLKSSEGFMIEYTLKLDFPTMNNEAEYEALITRLGLARVVRAKSLKICGESRLVVAQVNEEFEAKDDAMSKYLRVTKGKLTQFDEWYIKHVPRKENTMANALSKFASSEIENYPRIAHPQENKQEKDANQIILDGIKKRVECSRNTWVDALLPLLWAYCTACKVTTEVTPFMLAYGAEAVVLLEITHISPRFEVYEPETNEKGMGLTLDLIDEV
ncbi:uncharacterized protein LOC141714659 [Apium graveolens]|uniref:uncharacterized protein LOC141714659 n=1 Tax=Apium graveolens TaxID=4045 RepID=UPI003D7ACF03